mmetsp:Transcript_43589/g.138037  ORF Transcript_43589/g.138037 Transcript_43589/m.138037 type:complete len:290 (+) Transcript_43589:350-1219(+)
MHRVCVAIDDKVHEGVPKAHRYESPLLVREEGPRGHQLAAHVVGDAGVARKVVRVQPQDELPRLRVEPDLGSQRLEVRLHDGSLELRAQRLRGLRRHGRLREERTVGHALREHVPRMQRQLHRVRRCSLQELLIGRQTEPREALGHGLAAAPDHPHAQPSDVASAEHKGEAENHQGCPLAVVDATGDPVHHPQDREEAREAQGHVKAQDARVRLHDHGGHAEDAADHQHRQEVVLRAGIRQENDLHERHQQKEGTQAVQLNAVQKLSAAVVERLEGIVQQHRRNTDDLV